MRGQGSRLAGGATRIEVSGVLAPFVVGFRAALTQQGFTRKVVAQHTHLMADLSGWLGQQTLAPGGLTVESLDAFLKDRRARGARFQVSARGLDPLLDYLHGLGLMPRRSELPSTSSGPVVVLLEQYRGYLVGERGLAPLSVLAYLGTARLFLTTLTPMTPPTTSEPAAALDVALRKLSSGQVTRFVLREATRRGVWSAKSLTTALRSLLVFLHVAGHVPRELASAVPAVAGWRLSVLPRGIEPGQVAAMAAGCDRSTAMGRRDYAILLLLSRLGLRNGEVCRLELGDIDWTGGEILVRGKANRWERLPLPADVGEAVVDYLVDGRPAGIACRQLFVITRAPYTGLSLSAVVDLVVAAGGRAGVEQVVSPHRLRHTLAGQLLAQGASLTEVGQLLRHRSNVTTAIYAKLDHRSLDTLVRTWPGAS